MTATGVYGGVSAVERRAQRRERLLAAALQIMGTRGWSHLSVRGVCREAQLTPRFFYESFADLDALAVAVFDGIVTAATQRLRDAVEAADAPADKARAAIGAFVLELTDDPRRGRVACVESVSAEPLMHRRRQVMRDLTGLIAQVGRETYQPAPTTDRLVDTTATLLAGGIAELLVAWMDGVLEVGRDELIEDCAALFMATVDGAGAIGRAREAGGG
jgi:AcrR family transcriptional regulator